jgi:hypothetical protein
LLHEPRPNNFDCKQNTKTELPQCSQALLEVSKSFWEEWLLLDYDLIKKDIFFLTRSDNGVISDEVEI